MHPDNKKCQIVNIYGQAVVSKLFKRLLKQKVILKAWIHSIWSQKQPHPNIFIVSDGNVLYLKYNKVGIIYRIVLVSKNLPKPKQQLVVS